MSSPVSPIVPLTPRLSENGDNISSGAYSDMSKNTDTKKDVEDSSSCKWNSTDGVGAILFWTLIITAAAFLIFIFVKPGFVLKADSEDVDYGKAALAATIVGLSGVIIIWLIRSCGHRSSKENSGNK